MTLTSSTSASGGGVFRRRKIAAPHRKTPIAIINGIADQITSAFHVWKSSGVRSASLPFRYVYRK